jgi:Acetyltransferase (GNAT) family
MELGDCSMKWVSWRVLDDLMNHFGLFQLLPDKTLVEIVWLSEPTDWNFVQRWEQAATDQDPLSLRDSLQYAQLGAKRWDWLAAQGLSASSNEQLIARVAEHPDDEVGFALAVRIHDPKSPKSDHQPIAFCYVRRLWLNHLYLEFLAVGDATVRGAGSLLLFAVADIARQLGAKELWGECTALSQGFYRRLKARCLVSSLQSALEDRSGSPEYLAQAQLPGAVEDRFVIGEAELHAMRQLLRALWAY